MFKLILIGSRILLFLIMVCALYFYISFTRYQNDEIVPSFSWYQVTTPSMVPTIQVGDLILNQRVNPSRIKVGDIITFISTNPNSMGATVTHRVVSVRTLEAAYEFATMGDNNFAEDRQYVSENNLIGRTILIINPVVGRNIMITIIIILVGINLVPLLKKE